MGEESALKLSQRGLDARQGGAHENPEAIIPTTPLYLALCLTPLPMREIGAVIAPLPPGDEDEDLVNAIPPQG